MMRRGGGGFFTLPFINLSLASTVKVEVGDTQLPASWVAALFNMHHFHRDGVAKYCTPDDQHWQRLIYGPPTEVEVCSLHYIYYFVWVHTWAKGIIG